MSESKQDVTECPLMFIHAHPFCFLLDCLLSSELSFCLLAHMFFCCHVLKFVYRGFYSIK